MITCTVHEPPSPPADRIDRAEGLAFVCDGFSWSAALFTPIWLLVHRLWWPLLAYLAAGGVLELIRESTGLNAGWTTLAALTISLLAGFEADTLRRWSLGRGGWSTLGSISGRNIEDCERRFFDMWLPTQPIVTPPTGPAATAAGDGTWGWKRFLGSWVRT
ncbi:MAG TPA: DUF2628 domain-containing protein [Hyphomicrobiaceae bacterium]|nr:DUF2628 domain-containing protein [Hyphomicrobiaceae bacterium]